LPDDPLLSAAEAAAETGRALSTFWRDVRAGRLPVAYYVTPRCPRWRRSELRVAVDACRAPAKGAG
jgi:predicted DNA-binding transcriptional regulator AlpA